MKVTKKELNKAINAFISNRNGADTSRDFLAKGISDAMRETDVRFLESLIFTFFVFQPISSHDLLLHLSRLKRLDLKIANKAYADFTDYLYKHQTYSSGFQGFQRTINSAIRKSATDYKDAILNECL